MIFLAGSQEEVLDNEAETECEAPTDDNSICALEQEDEDTEIGFRLEEEDEDENTDPNVIITNSCQQADEKKENLVISKDIQAQKEAINDLIFSQCLEHEKNNKKLGNKIIQKWGLEAKATLVAGDFPFFPNFLWINKFKKHYDITGENFDLKIGCKSEIESSSVILSENSEMKKKKKSSLPEFKYNDDDKNDSNFEEGDVNDKNDSYFGGGNVNYKLVVKLEKLRKLPGKSTSEFKSRDNDNDENDSGLDGGNVDKSEDDYKPVPKQDKRRKSLRKSTSKFKYLDNDENDFDFDGSDYGPVAKRERRQKSMRYCSNKKCDSSSSDEHDKKRKTMGNYNLRNMTNNIKRRKIEYFDSSTDGDSDNDDKKKLRSRAARRGRRRYSEGC